MISREEALRELLLRALGGDGRAYHDFLEALGAHVRAFLKRRLSGMPDEVEDLVQETLLAVHNQRHTYEPGQPLTAWVHAIARYKLVDHFRRLGDRGGGQHVSIDEVAEDLPGLFTTSEADATDARRDLAHLLARLPDRHRLPIIHVKIEGLSVAQAARRCGMSESAVKVGVHRGLRALAAAVRKDHEDH